MPNFDDPVAPKVPEDWNYASRNIRQALVLVLRGDEKTAQQLLGEADAAVAQKRAKLDGRSVTFGDFAEDSRWRQCADYLALEFALSLQS
jgi:hypothetical protein